MLFCTTYKNKKNRNKKREYHKQNFKAIVSIILFTNMCFVDVQLKQTF